MEQNVQDVQFNNSMMSLNLYMVKDKTTGIHSFLYQSNGNDKQVCLEVLNYFGDVFKKLKQKDRVKFMESLHNSELVKIGSIDVLSGAFATDYNILADFKDVVYEKKEKEKEKNVE